MPDVICRSFARAGLLGNPSDGYHGKAIALSIGNFAAQVTLKESRKTSIASSDDESQEFDSLRQMSEFIGRCGFYGGRRLMRATLKRFADFCDQQSISLPRRNFELTYNTNIPRSVGLAGSSALITAALKAVDQFYETKIDKDLLASMALSVEKDLLGIPAGLMDRVIQMREGVVFMDFGAGATRDLAGFEAGTYQALEMDWLAERTFIAWADSAAEPTEVLHNRLRERFHEGDNEIIDAMQSFASFAEQGRTAIENEDHVALTTAINANYDLREKICQLPMFHKSMVRTARHAGGSAKFCGSGGAIIGTFDSLKTYEAVKEALQKMGCGVIRPNID